MSENWPRRQFPLDFTPELKKEALEIASHYRLGPFFTPPSLVTETMKGTISLPGSQGGANWPGAAFDPETGYLYYVASSADPAFLGLVHDAEHSIAAVFVSRVGNRYGFFAGNRPRASRLFTTGKVFVFAAS